MKRIIGALVICAVIAGAYRWTKQPVELLLNGNFELCDIPEGKPVVTNRVPGWGEVKDGEVKLLRLSNDTKVVWTRSATGTLQHTFTLNPRRTYNFEGDLAILRKGKLISSGRFTNLFHQAQDPEINRASSQTKTLSVGPIWEEFRASNYDCVIGDNFVLKAGELWKE